MELTVAGFQLIKEPTTLKIEGLTVLVGESTTAKSAWVRAFLAAINNRKGTEFINFECENADVNIANMGHSLRWTKGPKTSEYQIDGSPHKKSGRSTPTADIAKLGFYEVLAQDTPYRPQIKEQFDRPFIIGEKSPVTAAQLLAASKHGQILAKAVKDATKDGQTKQAEISVRETNLAVLKKRLERVLPFEERLRVVQQKATESSTRAAVARARRDQLKALKDRYNRIERTLAATTAIPNTVPPSVPDSARVMVLTIFVHQVRIAQHRKAATAASITHRGVKKPPQQLIDNVIALRRFAAQFQKIEDKKRIVALSKPPSLSSLTAIGERLTQLRQFQHSFDRSSKQAIQADEEKRSVLAHLAAEDQAHAALLTDLGVCPTCGQSTKSVRT